MNTKLKPAILDKQAVAAYLSLSETTIDKLLREGAMPQPRKLHSRRVGWLLRELDEWVEALPVSDLLPPPNAGYGRAGKPPEVAASDSR